MAALTSWKVKTSADPGITIITRIREGNLRQCLSVLILFLILQGCSEQSDESILQQYIQETVDAINAKDRSAAMAHAAPGLQVWSQGYQVKPEVLLLYYFRRFHNVTAFTYDEEIVVNGNFADVSLQAVLIGSKNLLPQRMNIVEIKTRWEKTDAWQAIHLSWQRKLLDSIELPEELENLLEKRSSG